MLHSMPHGIRQVSFSVFRCLGCHAVHVHLHVGTGDHVEQHINTLASGEILDYLLPVLAPVIDCLFGAKVFAKAAFLGTARRGNDSATLCPGKLDRRRTDAARSAVHQERLAPGEAAAHEDVVPDGEECFGYCRSFDQR